MTPRRDAVARLLAAPIAHRGLHACGAPGPVENSISAAEAAIAAGYGIECDVQLSRDGEAMVFHDARLARLTGHPGDLADHDAGTLETLALGGGPDRIPTLPAFLAAIDSRAPLVVEIKSEGGDVGRLAQRVLELIGGYTGVVALESFDPAVVLQCRRAGAPCPVGLVGPPEDEGEPDAAALAASDFISWNVHRLASVIRAGLPLSSWTVRTPSAVAAARAAGAQIVFEGFSPPIAPAKARR